MVDDIVHRREGPDPRFDADGSRREAKRDCRSVPSGAEVGERVILLLQIAPEKPEVAADLSAKHPADESLWRKSDHFMPVKRA